jgi:hypothetical protein
VYGKGISERDVVLGTATKPPMQARAFLDALNREAVGTAGKK